jgi:hypothetical protein
MCRQLFKLPFFIPLIRLIVVLIIQLFGFIIFIYIILTVATKCQTIYCSEYDLFNISLSKGNKLTEDHPGFTWMTSERSSDHMPLDQVLNCTILLPDINEIRYNILIKESAIQSNYNYTWICNPNSTGNDIIEQPILLIIFLIITFLSFNIMCVSWIINKIRSSSKLKKKCTKCFCPQSYRMTVIYNVNRIDDDDDDDNDNDNIDDDDSVDNPSKKLKEHIIDLNEF